ncbi:hypothetical protein ATZ33_03515 [Enterococcus silesiacus]|uniref:Uncharacterized protein n=1 Tax=Enterococcus silesiacus TaxID=332949 RepID=A0A0S3K8D7_9ENTE|nr:hypothetical protein [Enterococcus silesiacus]ALS00472.1 hypothetical protein ATZ33_03515 [Enterococcus silesiacus]OJG90154.1 hypothetical protein RV15_GL001418 [Enterococcus silesiacus]
MKSIYILLTRSKTYISKLIQMATADDYTHVSIAFDGTLSQFYSFGRKHPHFPLPAGLIQESLTNCFFDYHKEMPCALYELKVSKSVFAQAMSEVQQMVMEKQQYRYNIIGLVCCKFSIQYQRENYYFCSQFVAEILEKSQAVVLPKPAELIRPIDYANLEASNCLFKGKISELVANVNSVRGIPVYELFESVV